MNKLLTLLLLLCPLTLQAQTLTVSPGVVPPNHSITAEVTELPELKPGQLRDFKWLWAEGSWEQAGPNSVHLWSPPGDQEAKVVIKTITPKVKRIIVPGPNYETDKTDHKVEDWVYGQDEEEVTLACPFKVEGVGPTPDPEPDPDPQPGPAPIPEAKLNVLVIEETDDRRNLAQTPAGYAKLVAMQSVVWRKYVDGKQGEFKHLDPDVSTSSGLAPKWRDAMARKRDSLPWVIVSNGKAGYEGPMPANLNDFMTLLKKYGGE